MRDTPSTYTPFIRRMFGNERERELQETWELYHRVAALQRDFGQTRENFKEVVTYAFEREYPEATARLIANAACALVDQEAHIWELPAPDFHRMDLKEFTEYRSLLASKEHFFANADELIEEFYQLLYGTLDSVASELPALEDPTPFTIPLVYTLDKPRDHVEQMFGTLVHGVDKGLFRGVCQQLYDNLCRASGRDPDDKDSNKKLVLPSDSKLPLDELVRVYLRHTPLYELFMAPVPLRLTHEDRFNHWHVLAGSGQGKSVLIENMIRYDLGSENPPSIVLIDPHSDLVRKLVKSDLGIEDRLLLIDPRDTRFPVSLNPFAINRARFNSYDEATREQVTAGVIQTMGYLFNGITNLPLTGKQDVFFKYVTRLMLMLPEVEGQNATILDVLNLMRDPEPYKKAIEALPPIPRDFFQRDFMTKTYEATKEQIRYRLQAQIESPTMARLFTSEDTIDLYTELNRPEGAVILVDTAKDFLKDGSAVFGKLMISLILQAVMERAAIPEHKRKPAFIFIDEAGSFFSTNIDDLLTEARKYKAGILAAHQYLDQTSSSLKASLAANTGIKFAGGLSAQDASTIARDMRTSPDFILDQPKLHFAAHIRGVTPTAVSVPVKPIREHPRLNAPELSRLIDANRKRVSLGSTPTPTPSPEPSPQPESAGNPDYSTDWYDEVSDEA